MQINKNKIKFLPKEVEPSLKKLYSLLNFSYFKVFLYNFLKTSFKHIDAKVKSLDELKKLIMRVNHSMTFLM